MLTAELAESKECEFTGIFTLLRNIVNHCKLDATLEEASDLLKKAIIESATAANNRGQNRRLIQLYVEFVDCVNSIKQC